MAHDAPFPPNPFRPAGTERELAINLVTATLASAAVQYENASGERNWRRFAEAVVDNPKLLVLSDNWLKDHEIDSIMKSIRSANVELTLWRGPDNPIQEKTPEPPKLRPASTANPAVEHTLVTTDDLDRMNLELARLTKANEGLTERSEGLRAQIDHLAQWIVDHVDGEPSQSEGAVDTAIRVMRRLTEERNEHQMNTNKITRLAEWISKNIPAGEQDWTGNPVDTAIGAIVKTQEQIPVLRYEIEGMRAKRNRLAQWMTGNLPKTFEKLIADTPSVIDAAIMAMDELQRELSASQELSRIIDGVRESAKTQPWAYSAEIDGVKISACDEKGETRADQFLSGLRDESDRLTAWLLSEFGEMIDAEQSPVENAIDIIEELREKIRDTDRKAEKRRVVDEINEQSRRLAGKAKIPPQLVDPEAFDEYVRTAPGSIEDAKREAIKSRSEPTNRFKGVRRVDTLLGELAGAASMCWAHVERAGEFDSTKAQRVVEEALKQLDVIYRMQGANPLWITAVGDEETAEDRDAVAAIAARNDAIWMAPGDAAKAFIDNQSRLHILNEPDHGAVTNDLLKMVVERIDTLTKTVVEIVGGPQDEYAVRAEAQRDVDEEATEDTTFDNGPREGTLPESFLAEAREPWVKYTDEANDRPQEPSSQEWRQKISGVLGVRPGEMNYDLDTAVNKIGELRKVNRAKATGDEWRAGVADALGEPENGPYLGLAEAMTAIRDLRRLQSRW
ncbi:hypothetical protein SEA_NOSILAM_3 [Gordonia phage NosilaM]|uniref:Uncharacterized protein n=1 Tax=Gordonia phage NosilaM TaxID=2507863 RepID=A0A410TDZ0_9CAUD|nr:hypothetical protein KNU46_gp03 [Gordonia phage NosilaM]QAU07246.1 hypothetical protein SEA_NOSILAM_3 [Gordonia phage NosilaM]